MKPTNLNPVFIDQLMNFAHLLTSKKQTKTEFLNSIELIYSTDNPKTALFYMAVQKSDFDTIRLSDNRGSILFNH
jgi:hypothetical protein